MAPKQAVCLLLQVKNTIRLEKHTVKIVTGSLLAFRKVSAPGPSKQFKFVFFGKPARAVSNITCLTTNRPHDLLF